MKDGFFRLTRQSAVYAIGSLLLKGVGFLLAVLYLRLEWLGSSEFGYWDLLDTTARFGTLVGGLGLATGLLKYASDPDYKGDRDTLVSTAFIASIVLACAVTGLFAWSAAGLAGLLLDNRESASLVVLTGLYAALKIVGSVPLTELRSRERVTHYVTVNTLEALVLLIGVVILLGIRGMGLQGVLVAYVVSAAAAASYLTVTLLKDRRFAFSLSLAGRMAALGGPLVLSALAGQFLNAGDRYLLKGLADVGTVAVYALAAKISGVFGMVFVQSFQLAFAVIGVKVLADAEIGKALYKKTFRLYLVGAGWAVLGLGLMAPEVVSFVSKDPVFAAAHPLVFPYTLGLLAYGLFYIFMNVLYAHERTVQIAVLILVSAVTNAALNVVLIPLLGGMGAALATLLAYSLLAAMTWRVSSIRLDVRYPSRVLVVVVALLTGLYFAGLISLQWPHFARWSWLGLLILVYPVALRFAGILTGDDVEAARRWILRNPAMDRSDP